MTVNVLHNGYKIFAIYRPLDQETTCAMNTKSNTITINTLYSYFPFIFNFFGTKSF